MKQVLSEIRQKGPQKYQTKTNRPPLYPKCQKNWVVHLPVFQLQKQLDMEWQPLNKQSNKITVTNIPVLVKVNHHYIFLTNTGASMLTNIQWYQTKNACCANTYAAHQRKLFANV